jgi:putrescine aminotransferase
MYARAMTTPTFLHPFASPSRPADGYISIVSGAGAVVTDEAGNEYIDAMASLWYANIGYGRSDMAAVIAEQVSKIAAFHTFTSWTNPVADELAGKIAGLAVHDDPRVFFCSSGSEAVETAMKLARVAQSQAGHPERTVIISRNRGYHGVGYGGTSSSGLPPNQAGFGPFLGDVMSVDPDDLGKMEAALEERRGEVAAIITEPVQGAAGVFPPADGYLAGLRELCDRHGAYLIFDEVITGFGRLGKWFASQYFGVVPDLTTFAKAVTSGYQPLAGVIVSEKVRGAIEDDPEFVFRHGFTYSGHQASCAAGLENIAIIERESLLDRVAAIEQKLGDGFGALARDGRVSDVRGTGGMWAIGVPSGSNEVDLAAALLERGVISRAVPNSLTFCPPLVITDEQLDVVVAAVDDVVPR